MSEDRREIFSTLSNTNMPGASYLRINDRMLLLSMMLAMAAYRTGFSVIMD